jgi:hypothetical protein
MKHSNLAGNGSAMSSLAAAQHACTGKLHKNIQAQLYHSISRVRLAFTT